MRRLSEYISPKKIILAGIIGLLGYNIYQARSIEFEGRHLNQLQTIEEELRETNEKLSQIEKELGLNIEKELQERSFKKIITTDYTDIYRIDMGDGSFVNLTDFHKDKCIDILDFGYDDSRGNTYHIETRPLYDCNLRVL